MSTGNDFTSYEIINTYRTLLYASSTTPSSAILNEGFTTNLKNIRSGDGTNSPLQISSDYVNINGSSKLMLDGTILTASASTLNTLAAGTGTVTKITTGDNTVLFTEAGVTVATAETSLTAVVNPTLSITNLYASTGIFLAGSAIPSTADIAAVSALTSVNATAITSINTVVAAVSALTSVNATAITSINTVVAAVSALTSVNTTAITSINTIVAAVSALTSVNTTAITSINTVVAAVSALTSVNTTAITSINTVVAAVSALTSVNATAITSINAVVTINIGAITSINSKITAVSAALATSIANHLPLAGGTLSGGVSGTDLVLSGGLGLGTVTAFLGKKARMISGAAIVDIVSLTDGVNISVDLNSGQNFALTLAGNRTLDNPTNCVAGQVGSIFIVQDGTGSRTLAYGSSWDFPGGTVPVLTTDVAGVDRLDYIVQTSTDVQALVTKAYS
tara:strand:- start:204 stop:1559 length:1356 start_codon:yes stop_codon:yes gene_type:complete